MDKKLCEEAYKKIYGKNGTSCRDEVVPLEQWNEMMEIIEETLRSSNWVNNSYPAIHCIQDQVGWKMITIDELDGWQDLTWCVADVFGLDMVGGMAKNGVPMDLVRELAKMVGMPLAFDYGENSGYRKTDVEEDW